MPEVYPDFKSSERCKTCGFVVWVRSDSTTYCSPGCHSPIFRKRIILKCDGCSKLYSLMPCYKRKSNYCSMKCYWDSTRRKETRLCKVCGKKFWAKRPLLEKGFGLFCSRECQHKTYPKRIVKHCKQCGKKIEVCPSKLNLTKFCSKSCADSYVRDYVDLICTHCKKPFQLPRWEFSRGR